MLPTNPVDETQQMLKCCSKTCNDVISSQIKLSIFLWQKATAHYCSLSPGAVEMPERKSNQTCVCVSSILDRCLNWDFLHFVMCFTTSTDSMSQFLCGAVTGPKTTFQSTHKVTSPNTNAVNNAASVNINLPEPLYQNTGIRCFQWPSVNKTTGRLNLLTR